MTLFGLVRRALRRRQREGLALALGVALGTGFVVALLVLRADLERQTSRTVAPLVVGAPGSSLQLVLSELLFVDEPTGRIPRSVVAELRAHPSTRAALPVARGDAFHGYPVVATEPPLTDGTWASLREGRVFAGAAREVVVGAAVARALELRPEDRIELGHGREEAAHAGPELWTVVGVLAPTRGALDRALFIDLEAFYAVPEHRAVVARDGEGVTGVWLVPKAGMHHALLASALRGRQDLSVGEAEAELERLRRVMGRVDRLVLGLAGLSLLVALLGVAVSQHQAARARRRELALLRAIGAGRRFVYGLVVAEAAWICAMGAVLGLGLGYAVVGGAGAWFEAQIGFRPELRWSAESMLVALAVVVTGTLAGAVAARGVYGLDVPSALDDA